MPGRTWIGSRRADVTPSPCVAALAFLASACVAATPGQGREARPPVAAAPPATPCEASQAPCEAARWTGARVAYASDRSTYGVPDHQASAAEALARGRGDCEDIAAVALERLRRTGWPRDRAVVTVGLYGQEWHAYVVAWDEAGAAWVVGNDLGGLVRVWSWRDWDAERQAARTDGPPRTRFTARGPRRGGP